jgi:hypothetical protein
MPVSAQSFQSFVHAIEQGRFAGIFKGAVLGVIVLTVGLLYLFVQFAGLATPAAMEQAAMSRAIASGQGFTTPIVRPIDLWQLDRAEKPLPQGDALFPEMFHPPLTAAFNALPLLAVKGSWKMSPKDLVYKGDRAIAFASILLFLASVVVSFFVARSLFDTSLAMVACILILATDLLWQVSLSGLGHMLLLLLFMLTLWVIVAAIGRQEMAQGGSRLGLLDHALIGLGFGLMTLSNYLACWFFIGYLLFAFIHFKPRFAPLISILTFAAALAPWVLHNINATGLPFGLAIYPISQSVLLSSLSPDFSDLFYGFRIKLRDGVLSQVGDIFLFLGMNLAAGAFFVALLHPFKRRATAVVKWCVLAMWVAATIGMAAYGPVSGAVSNNQLHVIFIPVMTFFGAAMLTVLWNRLGFQLGIMRVVFVAIVVFLVSLPLLLTLFAGQKRFVQWPPYIPPYIAILGEWFEPNEAITSDMPWAVAWYAQRKSLLLPETPTTFIRISDYDILGTPIRGLYLTPITGDRPFLSEIAAGRYRAWSGLIQRNLQLTGFPLRAVLPLPVDGQCILYADYDRWSNKVTEP